MLDEGQAEARRGLRTRHRRLSPLYLSTALAMVLAMGATTKPALAQSVTAVGGVSPFPSPNPQADWNVGGFLYVGSTSSGTLTIEDGGRVENTSGVIGFDTGASGSSVTVSGTDTTGTASTWHNSGNLFVGVNSSGTLTIEGGGKVENTEGYIGRNYDVSGNSVTVSGTDTTGNASTWHNSSDLYVGINSSGTLTIEGGGKVENTHGYIGAFYSTAGSSVTVSGNASTWQNSGDLYVGRNGKGTLTIEGGGKVENTGGYIGLNPGTNDGSVTVSGTDTTGNASTWQNYGVLRVGFNSSGTVTIKDGGLVNASGVAVGDNVSPAGNGTINLLGSSANGRGVLKTGYVAKGAGNATLNLDGGILRATRNEGSFLRNFGALTVGYEGVWFDTQNFNVTIGNSTTFAGVTGVGDLNKIGTGTLTLTGNSSAFAGNTIVDEGTLAIAGGGKLGGNIGIIGDKFGSDGTVAVTASTWENYSTLAVGNLGTGELTIADGGTVSNKNGIIANQFGSKGTVTVTASTWENDDALFVGREGTGMLGSGLLWLPPVVQVDFDLSVRVIECGLL